VQENQQQDRFASTVVTAASIIAAVERAINAAQNPKKFRTLHRIKPEPATLYPVPE
jgi:hypothetical protein